MVVEKPLAAEEARTMQVPEGFNVTACEPAITQPIGFCIDDRGRLWVAEAKNYPDKKGKNDRIIFLEDTDGDGRHDERIVFYDKLEYVSGIEVGVRGAGDVDPKLLFHPGRGLRRRAGRRTEGAAGWVWHTRQRPQHRQRIRLGAGRLVVRYARRHQLVAAGKPGTPKAERRRLEGGVWRYHPASRGIVRGGHDKPVGYRLERLRPRLHLQLR